MTNSISSVLKYADLQMAAEALYEFDPKKSTGPLVPGGAKSYSNIARVFLNNQRGQARLVFEHA